MEYVCKVARRSIISRRSVSLQLTSSGVNGVRSCPLAESLVNLVARYASRVVSSCGRDNCAGESYHSCCSRKRELGVKYYREVPIVFQLHKPDT